jgi:two-component system OmpR family response regulator
VEDDVDGLAGERRAGRERVAPDDRQDVHGHQADRVPAGERVPAGQPVGPDVPFEHRDAGHKQHQQRREVARQQTGDPARPGQPPGGPDDAGGVLPPQRDDRESAGGDRDQRHGRDRVHRQLRARRLGGARGGSAVSGGAVRGAGGLCDGGHATVLPHSASWTGAHRHIATSQFLLNPAARSAAGRAEPAGHAPVSRRGSRWAPRRVFSDFSPSNRIVGPVTSTDIPAAGGEDWRVLVVDDEPDLIEVLCGAVQYAGWQARGAERGLDAVRIAAQWQPHAVVLDLMLPDLDGTQVLRRIHEDRPQTRVLLLTARDAVEDRIAGITAGADDYVTKPFSLDEVVARLRGLLRRVAPPVPSALSREDCLIVGDLVMDERAMEVTRAEDAVELSPTEFALLRYLMRHPRQVLSKAQILEEVWRYDFGGQAHVVELYISYLRKKVDAGRAPMIHTVRGAGYVLKASV